MIVAGSKIGSSAAPPDVPVLGFEEELGADSSREEFECIYRTYRSRIYSLCLRMTGNCDQAEDLTQDTFLRAFQKLDTFRGESSFYFWLRRVAINVVLLQFQKPSERREASLDMLAEPDGSADSSSGMQFGGADRHLLSVADRIDLQRALDRLAAGFRAVLLLHDVEGYEHAEVSRRLSCSVGTSKSQLHKARTRMRGFLTEPSGREVLAARPA